MIRCPPPPTLERYLAGILPRRDTTEIGAHVESCDQCRHWLTEAEADENLLEELLDVPEPPGFVLLPERIGDYRILRELGSGGMGVVYEAEQDNPRRRVALKVVRPGLATGRTLRRFEIEAQVLARLQHPGIAQIHQAGTFLDGDTAQPFFAMELIRGRSLRDYVHDEGLGLDQSVELFEQICAAVQHAHEKGVIHRDLKPSNILVDERGQPKVLDFGVARLQDAHADEAPRAADEHGPTPRESSSTDPELPGRRTHAGQLVGTLAYMSPEQVSGDPGTVDMRSDVHALGVVLFELLTGRLPYDLDGPNPSELVRAIGGRDRVRLSSSDPKLRCDLDAIVAKAMAREPEHRYASAAELAADLRRFRGNEPVSARPMTAPYQLTKFARRNRAVVGALAAVFFILVAGAVTAILLWQRAVDAAAVAHREAEAAEAAREFVQEILVQASPDQGQGDSPALRRAFDLALQRVDRLEGRPWVEAAVRHTLGRVQTDLGRYADADGQLTRSLVLFEKLYGKRHKKVAYVLTSLARVQLERGDYAAAEATAARAVGLRDVLAGRHLITLGTAMLEGAKAAYVGERIESAEALARAAIEAYAEAGGETSINAAISRGMLATIVSQAGRTEEAVQLYRAAIAQLQSSLGPRAVRLATPMGNLAGLLEGMGRLEEAEQLRRDALAIFQEHYDEDHPSVGFARRAVGSVLCTRGEFEEGLPLMREGLAIQEAGLDPGHPRIAQSLVLLGEALLANGSVDEAWRTGQRAADLASEAFGARHVMTLRARLAVAHVLSAKKDFAEARRLASECLQLVQRQSASAQRMIERANALLAQLPK